MISVCLPVGFCQPNASLLSILALLCRLCPPFASTTFNSIQLFAVASKTSAWPMGRSLWGNSQGKGSRRCAVSAVWCVGLERPKDDRRPTPHPSTQSSIKSSLDLSPATAQSQNPPACTTLTWRNRGVSSVLPAATARTFIVYRPPPPTRDRCQPPPTANRELPPTANRQPPPTANHCSILFLWSCPMGPLRAGASSACVGNDKGWGSLPCACPPFQSFLIPSQLNAPLVSGYRLER